MSVMSRIAVDWARRCFGDDHVRNFGIRALRTVEEALELCQALGVSQAMAHKAVDTVYSRPVGDAQQEIGGVLLTTAILCESMCVDYDGLFERELRRVLAKSPEHFAKRNQDKLDLGLDVSSDWRQGADDAKASLHHKSCGYPRVGCTCRAWETSPMG